MPTHTPSPHRFLAPNPTSAQRTKQKPPSALRNGFTAQTPQATTAKPQDSTLQLKKATPAKRFVVTPHRRNLSAGEQAQTKHKSEDAWESTNTQLTPRPKPKRPFERVESIEEPQSSPSAPFENGNGLSIAQSIEHEFTFPETDVQHNADGDDEMLFAPSEPNKRRRLSTPTSPTLNHRSEPTTPITAHNTTTHRFLAPPPRTPTLFAAQQQPPTPGPPPPSASSHRPQFILPPQPTSPPKPSKPLPEIFSPSRKNGRYLPNGLASTMQNWIIETANTGFAAQDRGGIIWGRDKEDGLKLKLRVVRLSSGNDGAQNEDELECFPNMFVFLRGVTDPGLYNISRAPGVVGDDGEIRVLLAGQGGARGAGGVKVKVGGMVGIRAPMWDVDVCGVKWLVAVDWVVL